MTLFDVHVMISSDSGIHMETVQVWDTDTKKGRHICSRLLDIMQAPKNVREYVELIAEALYRIAGKHLNYAERSSNSYCNLIMSGSIELNGELIYKLHDDLDRAFFASTKMSWGYWSPTRYTNGSGLVITKLMKTHSDTVPRFSTKTISIEDVVTQQLSLCELDCGICKSIYTGAPTSGSVAGPRLQIFKMNNR